MIYEVSPRRTVRWADVPSGIVMEVARDRLDGLRLDVRHWPWYPSSRVIDDTDLALLLRFGAETSTGILIGPEDFDHNRSSRLAEGPPDVDTSTSSDAADDGTVAHRLAATGLKTTLLSHWSALGGIAPLGLL